MNLLTLYHTLAKSQGALFPDHGGTLHRERRIDRRGRGQTRWVKAPEPHVIRHFAATNSSLKGKDKLLGVMANATTSGTPNGVQEGRMFGMDNGAYSGKFTPKALLDALDKYRPYRAQCKFVVAPDVLMDGKATEQEYEKWRPIIRAAGYPVAFVAHRGTTKLPDCDALFVPAINLDDPNIPRLVAEARRAGKWVHVGRVNSSKRTESIWRLGADSADGTRLRFTGVEKGVENLSKWTENANRQGRMQSLLQEAHRLESLRTFKGRVQVSQGHDEAAVRGGTPLDRMHPDDIQTGMLVGVHGDPRPMVLMTEPDEDGHVVVGNSPDDQDGDYETDPEIYHMADVYGHVTVGTPNRTRTLTARQMAQELP